MTVENGAIFIEYLRQCLAPTLRPGDIVNMDNLSAHFLWKEPLGRTAVAGVGLAVLAILLVI